MSNGSGGVLIYAVDCWPQFDTNPFFFPMVQRKIVVLFSLAVKLYFMSYSLELKHVTVFAPQVGLNCPPVCLEEGEQTHVNPQTPME